MGMEKLQNKLINYSKAVDRLKESLKRDETDDIVLDAVIQRFEFTYELSWKLLKEYLSYNGLTDVRTPREAFKEAFSTEVVDEGDVWIDMLNDRNLTSHTYDKAEAKEIYARIKNNYYKILNKLKETISKEIKA